MDFQSIAYERADDRARITLNRPEKLNALSGEMQAELNAALWMADDDKAVHAVILRGAGRAFCAGYDITPRSGGQADSSYVGEHRGGRSFDDDVWHMERDQRLRMAIFDMHKPVVAQVHGYCLAGALDIALLCDMVIAADDAVFGFPPARAQGSLPNNMWIYHCGPQWAKRLLLTGDTISGNDAAKIGLVLKSVPAAVLEIEVEGLVDRLAMIDTELLSANKRIVNLQLELMGARTTQRIAAETDARGHLAPSNAEFTRIASESGLKAALSWRDGKFGDGRARVDEPDGRITNKWSVQAGR